jgi:integrase
MFLSKTRSGIYYLYYTDNNGRRQKRSTKARHKSEALKFLTTFKIEREEKRKPILFSALVAKFVQTSKTNLRDSTISLYERARDVFIQIFGDMTIDKIGVYHWDMYKAIRLKKVSPITVNIELRNLRSLMNKAFRWGLVVKNPLSLQPICFVPEKYPVYFTHDEFKVFYNTIPEQWFKDFVLFAVLTGMRRSELTNLLWKDIDVENKIVQIQSSPTFRTKSGKKRVLPLHDLLLPLVVNAKDHDPEELIFKYEGRKILGNHITHKLKYVLKKSGIQKKGLHFHSLRHTFASWLVQNGAAIYEVQRLMGHSTIAVTEIYAHLQPMQLHDAVNRLDLIIKESDANH